MQFVVSVWCVQYLPDPAKFLAGGKGFESLARSLRGEIRAGFVPCGESRGRWRFNS